MDLLYHGDNIKILKTFSDNCIDTIITDPPYGLKFMGKKWDYDVPNIEIWKECLRVLKPGGTALIFAGSRTQHRMAVNVEDAGFVLKDTIMWLYGSGFPKAADISKNIDKMKGKKRAGIIKIDGSGGGEIRTKSDRERQLKTVYETGDPVSGEAKLWDGWKSHALKPAYEPILVCMKPNEGTYVNNALKWGVSGLNIDGGRIETSEIKENDFKYSDKGFWKVATGGSERWNGNGTNNSKGRYPANIILDEEAGRMLDEQTGILKSGETKAIYIIQESENNSMSGKNYQRVMKNREKNSDGASRFFYCAKASKAERNKGLIGEKKSVSHDGRNTHIENPYQRHENKQVNNHPTVKPLKLMEYLCELTKTPTGGTVLDPFAGSGTTGLACKNTSREYVLIEKEKEYCTIIEGRLSIKKENSVVIIQDEKVINDMKENKKAFFKVTKEKKVKEKTVKKVKEKTCDDCGLCRTCNTPKIKVTGRGKKEVLIIVDTPSQKDDRTGQLLSGMSGQLLQYILEKIDIKLNQDCFITSAIKCRPSSNKKPNIKQINICRKYLFETIEKYNPKLIICMGEIAWKSLMSKRMTGRIKNVSFSDFIGEQIPDQALKKWVCPVYLPGYILQNTKDKVLKKLWKRNIKKAFDTVDKLFPVHDFDDSIRVINEEKQAIECIDKIRRLDRKIIAFDYETTGLKPHRKGHKIVCASVCTGEYSYSFPFFASDEFRQAWKKLMMSKDIGKIAHNIGFEHTWTNIICNHTVSHWEWDTMLTAHSLHNRKKVNLKYLVFCKLGIIGFDSEVDEYIANPKKGEDKKSANAFNRIEECDEQLLLYYNAMDSLLTFQLYELQKKQISKKLIPGQQLFLKAAENLSEVPGIKINLDKKEEQKKILTEKMDRLHRLIMSSDEVQQTEEKEEFNFNSSKQLGNLLYNILKITCPKKTDTGLNSVDVDTLEKINIPLTKRILKYRKCKKIRDTYLSQYEREEVDSFLYPYFGLGTVKTYRSSSYNPNLQNVPVRNKEAREIVRSLIIPRKGNKLLAYDYASQEVRVAACYNQDPNLIKYIIDPTTDMHRDTAMDIFIKEKDEITKEERTLAKSCFVFPAFYGSYYALIAPDLWEGMSIETKQHLKNKGIKNYNSFENHIKKIEDIFWNEKFPVYAKWKKDIWNKYEKRGFIDHFTGFRCYGPIQRNKVINYATQGSAFHCLLWTFNRLVEEKHQFKKSHIIVEVHDEILFDAHPDDEAKIDYLMWYYATQKIKEVYPWLIVPLSIEKESSEINGSWAEMKDCGCLNFEKI